MNLSQHVQKVWLSHNFILETDDLNILQSDWLRAFWSISLEPDFFLDMREICTEI